jgi:hypothetical protein
MQNILERLVAAPPTLLDGFRVLGEITSPDGWNSGPAFVTRQIGCGCGSPELQVLTRQVVRTTGFLRKRQRASSVPPVYVSCPRCGRRALLFDPAIHGWDGMSQPRAQASDGGLVPFRAAAGRVAVNCSYQGTENYKELFADGVPHPQDFFDTFTVYYGPPGQEGFVEVLSFECA